MNSIRLRSLTNSKKLRLFSILAALTGVILWAGGVIGSGTDSTSPPLSEPLRVNTLPLQEVSSYEVNRNFMGQIESNRQTQLSFELGGKMNRILVDEGDEVEAGQVLATLDTLILEAQRESLAAQVASAKAKLDELEDGPRREVIAAAQADVARWRAQQKLARITTRRLGSLLKSQAISDQEFDEAAYGEEVISAQLDVSKARLEELQNGTRREQVESQRATWRRLQAEQNTIEIRIQKSTLRAPYRGVVSRRRLDEGAVIDAGQIVVEIFDDKNLEARVGLPSNVAQDLYPGWTGELEIGTKLISATVKSIRPAKNETSRTVDALFGLSDFPHPMVIGEVIELRLRHPIDQRGFWIPTDALVENYRGLWGCYVVESSADMNSTKAVLRELELQYQAGNRAFVTGAIRTGEEMVVSGVHRLVANQLVSVSSPIGDLLSVNDEKR